VSAAILEALERYLADDAARRGLEISPAEIHRRALDFCRTGHLSIAGSGSVRLVRSSYATTGTRRRARNALERQAGEQ
jgi:hypothetical protein